MGDKGSRKLYLDIARSIAMIWIIGWWHLTDYCFNYGQEYSFEGDESLTTLMLGLFMFISGLCIGRKSFSYFKDVVSFYRSRFWRFYVLYAISATTMPLLTNLNRSIPLLFTTIIVFSTFCPPPNLIPYGFEHVGRFLYTYSYVKRNILIYGTGAFVIMILLHILLPNGIDTNVFIYFLLYLLGLYLSNKDLVEEVLNNRVATIGSIVVAIVLFFFAKSHPFCLYVFVIIGIISSLSICKAIETNNIRKIVYLISYSSLCAYLFHRHIYSAICWIFELTVGIELVYLMTIALPLCIFISWIIQKIYDSILQRFSLS